MAYAAEQHVARRSAHGPFRLARNRRQPSADHLLFPAGHGRAVDQRRNRRLPKKAPAFVRPPHGGTAGRRHSGRRLELRASVVHDAPLEADHPRRFGTRRRRGNLPGRVGTRLRYGLELRTRRKLEPVDSRLHGRRFGSGVHTRRQGSRGLETVRAGGYRGATARLLGAAALHCRTDLPGRRRPVPGSAGTPAGIGTQQVVDRSRQSADAFAGLGT